MLFFAPLWMLGVFVGGICTIGAGEFLRACRVPKKKGFHFVTVCCAFGVPFGFSVWERDLTILSMSLLLMVLLFSLVIKDYTIKGSVPIENIMICFFAGILFPLFYGSLVSLRELEYGQYMVMLPMVAAFSTDTGAYFVGVAFGKHRNILQVSPNKSLEGFLGGLFFGVLAMVLFGFFLQQYFPVSLGIMGLYGFLAAVVTELGDLSFSLVKRQKGIKDYGNFIPGHGGILDRFDSMTFAAPTLYLLTQIIPAF